MYRYVSSFDFTKREYSNRVDVVEVVGNYIMAGKLFIFQNAKLCGMFSSVAK